MRLLRLPLFLLLLCATLAWAGDAGNIAITAPGTIWTTDDEVAFAWRWVKVPFLSCKALSDPCRLAQHRQEHLYRPDVRRLPPLAHSTQHRRRWPCTDNSLVNGHEVVETKSVKDTAYSWKPKGLKDGGTSSHLVSRQVPPPGL